ncbi:MAG TPA: LPS export ABC transporter permease LptF [Xanthobacteraceae bacterium]|nr:LPS export ABC transporter permease LptF [Xanthobacteraceae bacterium]
MGSIGAYIFRTTLGAFLVVLVSLTAIIWVTHALREFDLVTTQGQNVLVFLGITSLTIPLLVLVIAPLALVIAVGHVLNKLSTDSEIIVMNSAGMSPWRLFRPFFAMAILVSLLVGAISIYVAPQALRQLRNWITEVRADIVNNIVQPGRFTIIEQGLTFHIRARQPNGQLLDVLLDDQRNERERITLLAERGHIVKNEYGSFLVLENGSLQRHEVGRRDPEIVRFADNYFDLSQFATGPQTVVYSMRERYLWELLWPDPNDAAFKAQQERTRAELHDRIQAPLYPFAFVMIAYVFLGAPRTTRESRTWSILGVIGGVVFVRIAGFVGIVLGMQTPAMLATGYGVIFAACALCYFGISRGIIIEPPSALLNLTTIIAERWWRRAEAAG